MTESTELTEEEVLLILNGDPSIPQQPTGIINTRNTPINGVSENTLNYIRKQLRL